MVEDYFVKIPEQGGRMEQPDLLAEPKDGGREIAVEVETSTNHPEQIIKNYEKNVKQGRFVVFIVPNDEVESKVKESLKNVGKKGYRTYKIPL